MSSTDNRPLVLVVDDEAVFRELACLACENAGLAVVEAPNGAEAIECFRRDNPDIVLLDIVMPGLVDCGDIRDLTLDHLGTVRRKIADLNRLERTLSRISDACAGGAVPDCPVIDSLWAD